METITIASRQGVRRRSKPRTQGSAHSHRCQQDKISVFYSNLGTSELRTFHEPVVHQMPSLCAPYPDQAPSSSTSPINGEKGRRGMGAMRQVHTVNMVKEHVVSRPISIFYCHRVARVVESLDYDGCALSTPTIGTDHEARLTLWDDTMSWPISYEWLRHWRNLLV